MTNEVKKEVEAIIEHYNLDCSVEEFKEKADWIDISFNQKLSEDFIKEFKDKVVWYWISYTLSEDCIREIKDYIDWNYIPVSQFHNLSEDFIWEIKDTIGEDNFDYCLEKGLLTKKFVKEKMKVTRFDLMDLDDD